MIRGFVVESTPGATMMTQSCTSTGEIPMSFGNDAIAILDELVPVQ